VSKALREVWAWKEASYREVAHLPTREALREIIRRSQAVARELGFEPAEPPSRRHPVVAEERADYGKK
jgi:hypothetical protein